MKIAAGKPFGFTLVELLASMAIGSIVLLTAASLLGSSGESYERVGGGVATEREARALLAQIGSDLATGRFHRDMAIEKSSQPWPADRIGFLSLQPASAQAEADHIGDLCAVGYYVKDRVIGGQTIRCLMRGFRSSKETFAALESDSITSLFTARDRSDEPVAFGVVAFEARPKSRSSTGAWIDWEESSTQGPAAFEVRLVLARRELAGRLKSAADWEGSGAAGRQLGDPAKSDQNRSLETYSAFIRFGNHETP